MREVTIPAIEQGLAVRGLPLADFDLDYAPMIATGSTDQAIERAIDVVRGHIAFYGCTVAYRPVLEQHGWGELQDELIYLNRAHKTDEMAALVSDEMVETIALVGEPMRVIEKMKARFGGLIARTGFHVPDLVDDELGSLLEQLRD